MATDELSPPNLDGLVAQLVEALHDPGKLQRWQRVIENGISAGSVTAEGVKWAVIEPAMRAVAKVLDELEQPFSVLLAPVFAHLVAHTMGIDVPASALRAGSGGGVDRSISGTVATAVLDGLTGTDTDLQPGRAGAEKLLSTIAHMTLAPWFEGLVIEMLTTLCPMVDSVEDIAKLGHELVDTMGIGRLTRVALRPLVQTTVATPLDWHLNKTYRPALLGAGEAVRQLARGRWTRDQAFEELARQGYSDERIEALISAAAKYVSFEDSMLFERVGEWSVGEVIENQKQQGVDESVARAMVTAAKERRDLAHRDDSLGALRHAYTDRLIDDSQFSNFLRAIVPADDERAALEVAAQTARELNIQVLSHGEVKDAVKLGISSFRDYREWMTQIGYSDTDQLTLELLLRAEIQKTVAIAEHRKTAEAERAAEKQARATAAAARLAQVEAERALHRRGTLADLQRAVVRGLVTIDRYTEVLREQYDADTIDILVGLVEQDRQQYIDQARAADEARQRAAGRNLDVGAIEAAVLAGVLSLDQFANHPALAKLAPSDRDILVSTLRAKLVDRAAAREQRALAEARAKARSIDLTKFETLVRRGHRTLAAYDQLLVSLGFDDASRAALHELLALHIADDQAAATERAAAAAAPPLKGPTLDQMRRAVVLGAATVDDYQRYLIDNRFSADAQIALMADLTDALQQADAARARRDQDGTGARSPQVPLSHVARAARLGLILPASYQSALQARGYSDDDVALEMDLLVAEIADVQARRQRRTALELAGGAKGLTLAQVGSAVLAGAATIADYQARAVTLGYGEADVAVLVALLGDELAARQDAQARHDQIAADTATKSLSLGELDRLVKAGLKSFDEYRAGVLALGYGSDDADLLVALLAQTTGAAAPADGPAA